LEAFSGRLIVDVGCGTGESSVALAKENPCAFVLGVDKSVDRLRKARGQQVGMQNKNLLFIRAEIQDVWLHLKSAEIKPERQCFFYPNPWPKKKHLSRRLHAHPVFPVALSFGGAFELRTNWEVYAKEFASVVKFYSEVDVQWNKVPDAVPISAFEKKYLASGHSLYQLSAQIPE
jgi:tRNA G46 methylase TrmB